MTHYFRDVQRFHEKFKLPPLHTSAGFLPPDLLNFRVNFLWEEFQEYVDACKQGDLATAIDSLVDLIYVTCGTAYLHGFTPETWDQNVAETMQRFQDDEIFGKLAEEPYHPRPRLLQPAVNAHFTTTLSNCIKGYSYSHHNSSKHGVDVALATIFLLCLGGATAIGLKEEQFLQFWQDVQKCNMSKERVLRSEDSTRGSTYDVRKPAGWVGPRTAEILASLHV